MTPASPKKIRRLFKKCKDDTTIPWRYTPDCCYARAHRIADKASGDSVDARKICIKPVPNPPGLRPRDDNGNPINGPDGNPIEWTYHVAVVVTQQNADGTTTDMVIDPALFPGPVPVDDWVARVNGGQNSRHQLHPLATYHPSLTAAGFDPAKHAEKALRGHWRSLRALRFIGPTLPPAGSPVIRSVSRLSLWKGKPGRVRVAPGGWLDIDPSGPAARHNLEVIVEMGLIGRDPVAIWLGDHRTVSLAAPPLRVVVQSVSAVDSAVHLLTTSPRPLMISREHPRFEPLQRRAVEAVETATEVYLSVLPGSQAVDDLLLADWWDAKFGG